MRKIYLLSLLIISNCFMVFSQNIVDFEELDLAPESYWDGSDESGSFTSKYLTFYNDYESSEWGGSWIGFAYSNGTDVTTPGYYNQYSAASGSGVNGSSNYAVCFIGADYMNNYEPIPSEINVDLSGAPQSYKGMYISLNTYASLYMEQDNLYKDNNHFLILTITASDSETDEKTSMAFLLADYRFQNEAGFKLADWTYIDLSWANGKDRFTFTMNSSDRGDWGVNTPMYFCLDDFGAETPASTAITPFTAEIKENYEIKIGESAELTIFAKGGVQPYVYSLNQSWDDGVVISYLVSPESTTTYLVSVKDAMGSEISKFVTVNVNANNIEDYVFNDLNIYNRNGNIMISNAAMISNVRIYDLAGQLLLEERINSNNTEIKASHIPQGAYILEVQSGNKRSIKKILK